MPGRFLNRILMVMTIALLSSAGLRPAAAQEAPLTAEEVAQNAAEQVAPRTAVPFNAADFDKFVGYYQVTPERFVVVNKAGTQFYMSFNDSPNLEVLPESATKFFMQRGSIQISFISNTQGIVTGAILHQAGREMPAVKVTEAVAKAGIAAVNARIQGNKPDPARAAVIRPYVEAIAKGDPPYALLTTRLAAAIRDHMSQFRLVFARTGAFKSLEFQRVNPAGSDLYIATYENEHMEWTVGPLNGDGKVDTITFRRFP